MGRIIEGDDHRATGGGQVNVTDGDQVVGSNWRPVRDEDDDE